MPHACLLTDHDALFSGRTAASTCYRTSRWTGPQSQAHIGLAASCSNRALACARNFSFIAVGASPDWSVVPTSRRLHLAAVLRQLNSSLGRPDACESGERRWASWRKLALLRRALSEQAAALRFCDVLGFVDPDVLLLPSDGPLLQQPQLAAFLSDPTKLLFVSREPDLAWMRRMKLGGARGEEVAFRAWAEGNVQRTSTGIHRVSARRSVGKDRLVRNNMNTTVANTGFLLVKNHAPKARSLLRRWWCAPEDPSAVGAGLGEPLSVYRSAFAWEQRVLDEAILPVPSLAKHVQIAERATDYNTPWGRSARHFWFKPSVDAASHVAAMTPSDACGGPVVAEAPR